MVAPICPTVCGTGAGGAGGPYSATKISDPFQEVVGGTVVEADFTAVVFDVGPAITPDLPDNALVIEQDGFYEIIVTYIWGAAVAAEFATAIFINGAFVQSSQISEPLTAAADAFSILVELNAGDRITVQIGATTDAVFAGTLSAEKRN